MAMRWRTLDSTPRKWIGGVGTIAVSSGSATLEYSVDEGTTWIQAGIDIGVAAGAGTSFNFELPALCLIRLSGGSGHVGDVRTTNENNMEYVEEVEV